LVILAVGGGVVLALHLKSPRPAHASLQPAPGCFTCHGTVHCASCHLLERERAVVAAACSSPGCHPAGTEGKPGEPPEVREAHRLLARRGCHLCHREHGGGRVDRETIHRLAEEEWGAGSCGKCHQ
jgi:hypothetical protein